MNLPWFQRKIKWLSFERTPKAYWPFKSNKYSTRYTGILENPFEEQEETEAETQELTPAIGFHLPDNQWIDDEDE